MPTSTEKLLHRSDPRRRVTIAGIDLKGLTSKPGGIIKVTPRLGVTLESVTCEIQSLRGSIFELGPAHWDEASGQWFYITRTELPDESRVIQVTAVKGNHRCILTATQVPVGD